LSSLAGICFVHKGDDRVWYTAKARGPEQRPKRKSAAIGGGEVSAKVLVANTDANDDSSPVDKKSKLSKVKKPTKEKKSRKRD
jgi:hypothetical protein